MHLSSISLYHRNYDCWWDLTESVLYHQGPTHCYKNFCLPIRYFSCNCWINKCTFLQYHKAVKKGHNLWPLVCYAHSNVMATIFDWIWFWFFFFFWGDCLCLIDFILFLAVLGLCCVCRLPLVAVSRAYSFLWCTGFSSRWVFLLWSTCSRHAGSVGVAHRLSFPAAWGIFPDQGLNLCPLHW